VVTNLADREAAILDALTSVADTSRRDIQKATGLNQITTLRTLELLIAKGKVEATAPPKSPHRRYRRFVEAQGPPELIEPHVL